MMTILRMTEEYRKQNGIKNQTYVPCMGSLDKTQIGTKYERGFRVDYDSLSDVLYAIDDINSHLLDYPTGENADDERDYVAALSFGAYLLVTGGEDGKESREEYKTTQIPCFSLAVGQYTNSYKHHLGELTRDGYTWRVAQGQIDDTCFGKGRTFSSLEEVFHGIKNGIKAGEVDFVKAICDGMLFITSGEFEKKMTTPKTNFDNAEAPF